MGCLTWYPEQRSMPERPSCNLLIDGGSPHCHFLISHQKNGWRMQSVTLGKQIDCCKWLCKEKKFFFLFWPRIKWTTSGPWCNHSNAFGLLPHLFPTFSFITLIVYYNTGQFQRGTRWLCVFPSSGFSGEKEEGIRGCIWFWWNR